MLFISFFDGKLKSGFIKIAFSIVCLRCIFYRNMVREDEITFGMERVKRNMSRQVTLFRPY